MFLKKWTGKLRIKVLSLPATAKVVIGVAKIEELIASKGIYPLKNQANTFFIDNTGAALNHQYNHIASIKQGDQIFVMVKKANIKIMVNGDMCCYHLNNK